MQARDVCVCVRGVRGRGALIACQSGSDSAGMLPRRGRSRSWSWSCWLVAVCVAEAAGQCFVCAPQNRHHPDADADATSCEHFVATDERFIKVCKPFRGCLTEFDGDGVKRLCSEDDTTETCHLANGVRYCYCKEPLCNGGKPPPDDAGDDDADGDAEGGGSGAGGLQGAAHATPRSRSTPVPAAPDPTTAAAADHAAPPLSVALLLLGVAMCV